MAFIPWSDLNFLCLLLSCRLTFLYAVCWLVVLVRTMSIEWNWTYQVLYFILFLNEVPKLVLQNKRPDKQLFFIFFLALYNNLTMGSVLTARNSWNWEQKMTKHNQISGTRAVSSGVNNKFNQLWHAGFVLGQDASCQKQSVMSENSVNFGPSLTAEIPIAIFTMANR